MLGRIDVREAGARHHEMQAVRRDRAVEQMVRRARLAGPRLVIGIGQRAHHVLFVFRRRFIGRYRRADLQAPRIDRKRLGRSAGERTADTGRGRARNHDPAPE